MKPAITSYLVLKHIAQSHGYVIKPNPKAAGIIIVDTDTYINNETELYEYMGYPHY